MRPGGEASGWFAGLGCPALLLDPASGKALLATAGLAEMLGGSRQEVAQSGMELLDQGYPPYDQAQLQHYLHQAALGQVQLVPWPRQVGGIEKPWIELEFRRVEGDGKDLVVLYLKDITIPRRLRQDQVKLERALAKRVAELECLYKIFGVFETKGLPLEMMYINTLEGITQGWSWPEAACARLVLGQAVHQTANFSETPWRLTAPVKSEEHVLGILEVGYLEPRPQADEGPFLMEEKELLEAVAGRLGRIIERRNARDELRKERDFARNLVETAQVIVLVLDTQRRIVFFNPFLERLSGFGLAEVKGLDWFDTFRPPEFRDGGKDTFLDALTREEASSYLGPMVDRQGIIHQVEWSVRPLRDHSGQVSGLLCTGQDVTERLVVEQERQRLAAAVEQAAESIVIADSHGRITYVNPACERLGGYDSQELLGKEPHVLLEKKAAMQAIVAQVTRGLVWVGRLGLTKKNGDRFMAECTVSPIRTEQGKVVAYVSLLRDITMDLRLQDHLRQSQKMEAMGTLAGGIAHDFNNILGAIIGYAELAKMNAIRPGQYEGYLDLSLRACQRAKDLVQQILTFSRQAEQEKRPVDMVVLLKESFKLLRATFPSTMEMILHVHVPVAPVLADATQLHQVVMNLCTNAAHAMRDQGGSLEVGLRGVEVGKADLGQYPGLEPGPYIKLSVSDQGHGMTPEVAARIFDPFFTTKAPGEGTGLGLAVAHGIVTGCGGTIRVYSEPGMGATFHVMLPMLRESKEESQVEEREPPRGREHVLLVDDEEALVHILTRFLYDLGYRISAFTSPVEALKAFKESPYEFDLILSDLTMPNLTGLDLAQEVAAIRQGLPFLLCTGFSENITAERARVLGIREVVLKPILRRPLAEAIRRALDGASSPGAGDTP